MRIPWLLLVAVWGCGGSPSGGRDSGNPDDPLCGDGTCSDGELCSTCANDCRTLLAVCGNGECTPDESSETCFDDCGPSPWTWATDEQSLLDQINALRTGGFKCPGAAVVVTAPPLALEATMVPAAHEWVWEVAHQSFAVADGGACNGRTLEDRARVGGDFVSFVLDRDHATLDAAIAAWKASPTLCPILMNPQRSQGGPAVALDAAKGYLLLMK